MARNSSITIKDHFRETHLFQRRILVTIIFVVILLAIIVSRLFYLQVIDHKHYTTLSEKNRLAIRPIAPIRGLIYDRNGVLLAQNVPMFTLQIIEERSKNKDPIKTIRELQKLIRITDDEIKNFYELKEKKRRFEGVTLRYRLNPDERDKIAVNLDRFPDVVINAELTRDYPNGNLASHAIGYMGRINEQELTNLDQSRYSATKDIGKVGVERSYEDLLHGEVGFERVETDSEGRILTSSPEVEPEPGKDLYMTIDVEVQEVAEQAFIESDNNGALVAIDPNTGEIIAFVSMPTFDPNLFVNGIDSKSYATLSKSPEQPLFNRALQGQYPPGSTIKPYMALAGLEYNLIRNGESLKCPGYYMLKNDDRKYRDWKKEGHGETDLQKAIIQSCDVYFYDLALLLKIDRMHEFLSRFGLGKPTGIDIRGEENGILPSKEWKRKAKNQAWFPGETLITGIGQGFTLTTPLQLAHIMAIFSNSGTIYKPRIIHAIGEPGLEEITIQTPRMIGQIEKKNPENWKIVKSAMTKVVHSVYGTARGINRNLEYKVAGKTGTAQVFGMKEDEEYDEKKIAKKLRDHALFIGFAPADEPKIAVAVIVENGGSGGAVAAPIARKVMDAYLLKSAE